MAEKETKTPAGENVEIVEKRIKPAVIRRRAAAPKKVEVAPKVEEPKEVVATESTATEATSKPVDPNKKKAKSEEQSVTAKKTASEGGAVPSKKLTLEKKPEPSKKPAPKKKVFTKDAKKDKTSKVAPKKKEVTVFGADQAKQPAFVPRQIFRKGKRYQVRPTRRKVQIQPGRELKKTEITEVKAEKRVVRFSDVISVGELSQRLGVKAGEIIKKLMALDIMATVNQFVDVDSATLIAEDYGYEVENVAVQEDALLTDSDAGVDEDKITRPPVVTVMGHVDHGKTSLLDAIRSTNVVSGEAGGITQHIGAHHVHLDKGDITFLDTPGHEAFTAMRARGAKVTDLVILVVAADDGIMPQTIEAIHHAKAAEVPIIIAINKVDLPASDPEKIKQSLTEFEIVPEEWGGENLFVEVSAKKGTNVKELLEVILMQAEMLELRASVDAKASGIIVEAKLDKGRGPVATVLVQNGTLKTGDTFVAGSFSGKVRAMTSDWGKKVKSAGSSMPVEIIGLGGVPDAGDAFIVVKDEATARQVATMRKIKDQEAERLKSARVSLDDLFEKISKGEAKELKVVLKADVQGSIEAVKESISKLSTEAVAVNIIHDAAGGITEGDIMLASASNAVVIGFNVRPEPKAAKLAELEAVDLRLYNVIYNVVDDIRNAMEGLLEPIIREEALGRAEIREVFKVTKVGTIAGSFVLDGKIPRSASVRLLRGSVVIFEGGISSLKRFKEDAKEVQSGYECGIGIEGYNDIKVGDIIEAYVLKEEAAKL